MAEANIGGESSVYFCRKVDRYFQFLVQEMNYSLPLFRHYCQENGVVISDTFIFSSQSRYPEIHIHNAYHPVDYGFEIKIVTKDTSSVKEHDEMIYYVLKEEQDVEQEYLRPAAEFLREYLYKSYG